MILGTNTGEDDTSPDECPSCGGEVEDVGGVLVCVEGERMVGNMGAVEVGCGWTEGGEDA